MARPPEGAAVRPLEALPAEEARALVGVAFDLDDTLLDHGALTLEAYAALFRLREAGLGLLAVTGRPAGWAAVLARQWPVLGAVSENGAVLHFRRGAGVELVDGVVHAVAPAERAARRARLAAVVGALLAAEPTLAFADDSGARLTDLSLDIGERAVAEPAVVARAEAFLAGAGVRTVRSSVHLHATLEGADKASGAVAALGLLTGADPTAALARWAWVGDSGNDAACFAAFRTTVGVANLSGRFTRGPRFGTRAARGAGFAELAEVLLARRGERTVR